MAVADYRLCDVCGNKTFYDSNLDYEHSATRDDDEAFKVAGKPQAWGHRLFRLGDWAVICIECAKTHRTQIVRTAEPERATTASSTASEGGKDD